MPDRKIEMVVLTKHGSNPLIADENFEYQETTNGVIMLHGRSATLIPWHRIYEVQYVRV